MMEMALGGRPDDSAKIVCSCGCIVYLPPSPLRRQRSSVKAFPGGMPIKGDQCQTAAKLQHFMLQKIGHFT
jgi:hypothetical protein